MGLRWWSNVKEDGTNEWVFESLDNMAELQPADSKLFWIGLYVNPAVWAALFVIGLLKFNLQWLVIVCVALALSAANIVGYTKCSKDAKQKVGLPQWRFGRNCWSSSSTNIHSFMSKPASLNRGKRCNWNSDACPRFSVRAMSHKIFVKNAYLLVQVQSFMQNGAMAAMGNAGVRNMMFSMMMGGGGQSQQQQGGGGASAGTMV